MTDFMAHSWPVTKKLHFIDKKQQLDNINLIYALYLYWKPQDKWMNNEKDLLRQDHASQPVG